jgi:hypothetical protein
LLLRSLPAWHQRPIRPLHCADYVLKQPTWRLQGLLLRHKRHVCVAAANSSNRASVAV